MYPPQREVLFAYFNFSLSPPPPSTRGSLCLVDNELNEHSPPQREVLFAYLNFSLSPPPPSTRGSLCLVDNELNEHSPPPRPCNPLGFFVSFFQFYQTRLVQLHPNGFQAGANIGFSLRAPQGLATPLGSESFFPFYQTCLLQAGPQPCIH